MRRGTLLAAGIFLSFTASAYAAPATRPAVTPMSEADLLRAENARLRAEVERLRATTKPATAPASQPAPTGEMTVQQLVAIIPPAILYPDKPGLVGGSNSITQQRLSEWVEKNLPGKKLVATVPFRGNGAVRDEQVLVSFGDIEVPIGKKRFAVRISSGSDGYRNVQVPAAVAETLLKMRPNKDTIQVSGTIATFRIDNEAIIIATDTLVATLPKR